MREALRDSMRMVGVALVFLVVFAAAGIALQLDNRADAITPVAPHTVDSSGQDVLVDAGWLSERLESESPPVVLDVSDSRQYAREHIPGAVHLWWQDTMNLNGAGYGEAFSLSAPSPYRPDIGATQDDTVVVYDNMSSKYASRVVWQLRTSGYANAKVLDGGLAAWKGAGHQVSDKPNEPAVTPAPMETWLADNEITTDELAARYNDQGLVLLDTRNDEQRRDTVNDTIRAGQIPGSRSLPASSVMRDDGAFRSSQELIDLFSQAGVSPDKTIVVYGRFGVETGQVWLALRLAGYDNVRVYDDGWVAWGYDQALPIEPASE